MKKAIKKVNRITVSIGFYIKNERKDTYFEKKIGKNKILTLISITLNYLTKICLCIKSNNQ